MAVFITFVSMELICHNCGAPIGAEDVNIATDMAKCNACNSLHRASTLLEKVSVTELMTLPQATKLQMEQGRYNSIVLRLPAKGFDANAVFVIFFSIFWIGFVAVWTVLAAMGSSLFALFSLPFWFAGFMMVKGVINDINEVQQVTFNNDGITIEFIRPIRPKKKVIDRSAIQDVRLDRVLGPRVKNKGLDRLPKENRDHPAIITAEKTHHFFQTLTQPEKQWVVRLLKHTLVGK